MRKKNIIANITCGEISDLLILLDSPIKGDIQASSLLGRISLQNVENCIKKLVGISPDTVSQISDMLRSYNIVDTLREHSCEEKRILKRILVVYLILAVLLIFIYLTSGILHFIAASILIILFVLGIALSVYAITHTSYTLDDYFRLTQEDKEMLIRYLSDLIEMISRKIIEPIAIYLHETYPNTKRIKKYAIIQSKRDLSATK